MKGRRILPPVMTDETRLECQEWKRRALEVLLEVFKFPFGRKPTVKQPGS